MILLIWAITLALAFLGGMSVDRWLVRLNIARLAEAHRVTQAKVHEVRGRW